MLARWLIRLTEQVRQSEREAALSTQSAETWRTSLRAPAQEALERVKSAASKSSERVHAATATTWLSAQGTTQQLGQRIGLALLLRLLSHVAEVPEWAEATELEGHLLAATLLAEWQTSLAIYAELERVTAAERAAAAHPLRSPTEATGHSAASKALLRSAELLATSETLLALAEVAPGATSNVLAAAAHVREVLASTTAARHVLAPAGQVTKVLATASELVSAAS